MHKEWHNFRRDSVHTLNVFSVKFVVNDQTPSKQWHNFDTSTRHYKIDCHVLAITYIVLVQILSADVTDH